MQNRPHVHIANLHLCRYPAGMIDPLNTRSLQKARELAGLSRAELAGLAGVNETTILRIERGDVDPRVDGTWAPIVKVLAQRSLDRADAA